MRFGYSGLLIEQTKSRPRKCNDNGLVESKNGGVIRKHMGFDHIASEHAASINAFYEEYFNPYLNFHRPCAVPERKKDDKGKTISVYKWYATPWEILRHLPGLAGHLKDDVTASRWTGWPAPTAIRERRRRCAKRNTSCSPASNKGLRTKRHFGTMSGAGLCWLRDGDVGGGRALGRKTPDPPKQTGA